MRTVLITGAAGSGRSTVAAATALAAARAGHRTLLLSTDRSGTIGRVLGQPLPAPAATTDAVRSPCTRPVEVAGGLWAARLATAEYFRSELADLQERARGVLDFLGAHPGAAEEATELPGADALTLLAAVRAAHRATAAPHAGPTGAAAPRWDALVVDLPPATETVHLLALPDQLGRYLRRLLPAERQAARALHPMLAQLTGVPMPAQRLYETSAQWQQELTAVQQLIDADALTVRLVVDPGPLAARALRTVRAGLALHGARVDALIANRLLPTGSADPWLTAASGQQQTALKELKELNEPVGAEEPREPYAPAAGPVPQPAGDHPRAARAAGSRAPAFQELPHLGRDPQGLADLAVLADAVGPLDARRDGPAAEPWTVEDRLADDGLLVWRLPLPGADRDDLDLVRRGDELVVTVGPFRRVLPLPSALRRCTVAGAGLHEGALQVRFAPDPGLWPRGH
ncbi:ArsA-related P-loop ATPase [Streptomyces sp. HSW2009]|uniref:ArsA family ATPase n=1 Tax=Streptomyces sp. HSW2009 TaxID=3142890 RepID=UPI0032EF8994